MTRIRYTMPAGFQGELRMRGRVAGLVEKDVHRWVFVYGMDSDVGALVREWLVHRLDNFYCGLQVMYIPCFTGSTRVVLNDAPPLRAIVKATGLCDRLSNPLIGVDVVVHKACPDAVCDLGCGIAPGTVFEAFSEEGCGLHASVEYAG